MMEVNLIMGTHLQTIAHLIHGMYLVEVAVVSVLAA